MNPDRQHENVRPHRRAAKESQVQRLKNNEEQEDEVSRSQREYLARLVSPVSDQSSELISGYWASRPG